MRAHGVFALDGRGRSRSARRGVLLNGHTKLIKRAIVLRVLFHDAFRNGLGAFESRAGVKIDALLATMDSESAFRAGAAEIRLRRNHGPTVRAARAHHG